MNGDQLFATGQDAVRAANRLCFFAHYDPDGIVADTVLFQLRALAAAGFTIVLASTSALSPDQVQRLEGVCADVILRENSGLDFGSWRDIHARYPDVRPDLLLLANDSVFGPLFDLGTFLDTLLSHPADFYGIVGSTEIARHAQSWFLLFRPAAYQSQTFQQAMQPPADNPDKWEIIRRYEIGLTASLESDGLTGYFAYDQSRDGLISRVRGFNAGHLLWRDLVESRRSPFVKAELLRDNPASVGDIDQWRTLINVMAPSLGPAIDALLARQPKRLKNVIPNYRRALVYLPRVRPFLVRDFQLMQAGRTGMAKLNAACFHLAYIPLRIARVPYELLVKAGLLH